MISPRIARRPGGRARTKMVVGLCVPAAFLLSGSLGAQVTLGVQGGLARFTVKGDAPQRTSYANSLGATGGIIVEWSFAEAVSVSFQPSWTQKGARVLVDVRGVDEPVDSMALRLDYLSLPLLLKVSTPNRGGFVTVGVDVAHLQSAGLTVGKSEGADVKDLMETTDLSALFGVGGTLRKTPPAITLELRYHQSLLRVLPGSAEGPSARALPGGFRSSGFELNVGLLLAVGGGTP